MAKMSFQLRHWSAVPGHPVWSIAPPKAISPKEIRPYENSTTQASALQGSLLLRILL
jgi:hypothetical protein